MYSDQPLMPSSVVIFRKELTRQPASQCRSSILVIFTECSRAAGGHHAPPPRAGSTPRIEARPRPEDNRAGEKGAQPWRCAIGCSSSCGGGSGGGRGASVRGRRG